MAGKEKEEPQTENFSAGLVLQANKEHYTHGTFNIHGKII